MGCHRPRVGVNALLHQLIWQIWIPSVDLEAKLLCHGLDRMKGQARQLHHMHARCTHGRGRHSGPLASTMRYGTVT